MPSWPPVSVPSPQVPQRPPAELLAGQTARALLVSHLPAGTGELWKVMTEAGSSKSQCRACRFFGRANTVRLLGVLRGGAGHAFHDPQAAAAITFTPLSRKPLVPFHSGAAQQQPKGGRVSGAGSFLVSSKSSWIAITVTLLNIKRRSHERLQSRVTVLSLNPRSPRSPCSPSLHIT